MSGLDLTTGQKVQVGFMLIVLAAAGWFFYSGSRAQPNTSVNAWTEVRKVQVDEKKPWNAKDNPWDPKKEMTNNVFACYDGQLWITEWRNDPQHKPQIKWGKLDLRRKEHIYYEDPMAPVARRKDPVEHALALSAYNAANGRLLGLMNSANLTPDQLKEERGLREKMTNAVQVVRMQVQDGSYHTELLDHVKQALAEYRRAPGDAQKDVAKADAVRKVLAAATAFLGQIEKDRQSEIEKYISAMIKLLTSDQKTKIASAGKTYEAGTKVARGPGPTFPLNSIVPTVVGQNRGAAPNRGAGARGNPPPKSP